MLWLSVYRLPPCSSVFGATAGYSGPLYSLTAYDFCDFRWFYGFMKLDFLVLNAAEVCFEDSMFSPPSYMCFLLQRGLWHNGFGGVWFLWLLLLGLWFSFLSFGWKILAASLKHMVTLKVLC